MSADRIRAALLLADVSERHGFQYAATRLRNGEISHADGSAVCIDAMLEFATGLPCLACHGSGGISEDAGDGQYVGAPCPFCTTDHGHTAEDAWMDLVEKTDRTSPAEYPEMVLITFEELRDYMREFADREIERLREALAGLVDDEPCHYDHNGDCQAHFVSNPCEMAVARTALASATGAL